MITKYTPAEKMPLTELKTAAKKRGYIVKKLDGEIEIYPKGKRGDASYFTDDALDAFKTMRMDFVQRQSARITFVTAGYEGLERFTAPLLTYAMASGRWDWTDHLLRDWYRAGSTTVGCDTYSQLHRLRNHPTIDGHEILRQIAKG
jgi:hypothetical protein